MKKIIILFFILLAFSFHGCENQENKSVIPSVNTMDTIKNDKSTPSKVDSSSSEPEEIEIPEEHYLANKKKRTTYSKKTILSEESGLVRYDVPDSMSVGVYYSVNIRISKQNDTSKITINMPQGKTECTRVGSEMDVQLIDEDGGFFEIKPLDSEIQTVEDNNQYTEWAWTVRPLKGGIHRLRMLITIKQQNLTKDVPVFEKDIFVESSFIYNLNNFWSQNWQMILTSMLIPFFGFLWHLFYRDKKKKRDRKNTD